jgi:hypothetical protein
MGSSSAVRGSTAKMGKKMHQYGKKLPWFGSRISQFQRIEMAEKQLTNRNERRKGGSTNMASNLPLS